MKDSVSLVIYSTRNFGLIAIFEDRAYAALLNEIIKANPDQEQLMTHFQFPGGHKIIYNVYSPRNKWVIKSDNEELLERDFDNWPLIDFKK